MAISAFGVEDNRISKASGQLMLRRTGAMVPRRTGAVGSNRPPIGAARRGFPKGKIGIAAGAAAAVGGGAYAVHRRRDDDADGVSKADRPSQGKASSGRLAAASALPGWHAAVAGRKGKKLRAVGNEAGGTVAGAIGGGVLGSVLARGNPAVGAVLGAHAGGIGGAIGGAQRAQRKGYFKAQS